MGFKDLTQTVNFIDVMKAGIEGAWMMKKKKATLNSLDVEKNANKTTEDWSKVKFILDTLKDETVENSLNILTSLKSTINDYANTEISKQPLTALKTYFDNEYKDV